MMGAALPMYVWTIYDGPSDFPGRFVVRRFRVTGGAGSEPEARPWSVKDSLLKARGTIPGGLYLVPRARHDEPQIVESWL